MTQKITDLEGRLDAALKRADKKRLTAAAPELLEIAKLAAFALKGHALDWGWELQERLEAIIAKAEGKI